ncbi:MAG: sigma-70 family RNA polymerase sigma factor [Propionicimonas sp.]|uniref:sigma-70 family RNA polymerase sigma factor n=1 Tax=Propionicimonas sp. TaxID=1955623 RepID=UPI002B1FCFBE|nr:sigma-70 family RNA polymerase sigma factor [Propionicimonas sp.]MEA4944669.1 sigma-70 family RNA polymerase sigma factor [Propionicimonas sp.]MEA5117856.1 sigma-70 family RNA polymerase sigma factor [Propionicimonas sp.]
MTDDLTVLALAAGAGDRAALSEFIRASQAPVWRFVARAAGVQFADDLAQETYLRAIQALPGFQGRSSARTWLLSIAHRVVVDRVRHEIGRPRLVGLTALELDELAPVRPDHAGRIAVEQALDGLAPERRTALVLTQLMGFSYAEAAEICDCPVGTIRSRVARARAELLAGLAVQPVARHS